MFTGHGRASVPGPGSDCDSTVCRHGLHRQTHEKGEGRLIFPIKSSFVWTRLLSHIPELSFSPLFTAPPQLGMQLTNQHHQS